MNAVEKIEAMYADEHPAPPKDWTWRDHWSAEGKRDPDAAKAAYDRAHMKEILSPRDYAAWKVQQEHEDAVRQFARLPAEDIAEVLAKDAAARERRQRDESTLNKHIQHPSEKKSLKPYAGELSLERLAFINEVEAEKLRQKDNPPIDPNPDLTMKVLEREKLEQQLRADPTFQKLVKLDRELDVE